MKPRDRNPSVKPDAAIHHMNVRIGDLTVRFHVLPGMLPQTGFIGEDVCEHIKQTFAPTHTESQFEHSWEPYQARHKHIPCAAHEGEGNHAGFDSLGKKNCRCGAQPIRETLKKAASASHKRDRNWNGKESKLKSVPLHHEARYRAAQRTEYNHRKKQEAAQAAPEVADHGQARQTVPHDVPDRVHPTLDQVGPGLETLGADLGGPDGYGF